MLPKNFIIFFFNFFTRGGGEADSNACLVLFIKFVKERFIMLLISVAEEEIVGVINAESFFAEHQGETRVTSFHRDVLERASVEMAAASFRGGHFEQHLDDVVIENDEFRRVIAGERRDKVLGGLLGKFIVRLDFFQLLLDEGNFAAPRYDGDVSRDGIEDAKVFEEAEHQQERFTVAGGLIGAEEGLDVGGFRFFIFGQEVFSEDAAQETGHLEMSGGAETAKDVESVGFFTRPRLVLGLVADGPNRICF